MKRLAALLVAIVALPLPASAQGSLFTATIGFATKTGFRGVFAWQAIEPVTGVVRFGTSPDALTRTAQPNVGAPDRAQMAFVDDLTIGTTYYWRVEDTRSGELSAISSFVASNAWNDWNGAAYTQNLVVQLDAEALPDAVGRDQGVGDLASASDVFAERVYDALDGYARIGKVIVTDTNLDYAANVPSDPVQACMLRGGNLSDVLVETTQPLDSHTFGGYAISDKCTQVYMGRLGFLGATWPADGGLFFGYVLAHEWMHYAFGTPDLYGGGSNGECVNSTYDISLMHNSGGYVGSRWRNTELDRSPAQTPCSHGSQPWSWDRVQNRYPNVPEGPVQNILDRRARGNLDGGALEIYILDRTPAGSTLTRYTAPE